MRRAAKISVVAAVVILIVAVWLWWDGGASQLGDLSTRGLVRTGMFVSIALVCHAVGAWLAARGR